MRVKTLAVAAAASVLLITDVGGASAGARVEQRDYVTAPVLAFRDCAQRTPAPDMGGGCFYLADDDTTVSIVVDDDSSERVNVVATLYAPLEGEPVVDGFPTRVEPVGRHEFCSDSGTIAIPDGAVMLGVSLSDVTNETVTEGWGTVLTAAGFERESRPCDAAGGAAGATAGVITATFG